MKTTLSDILRKDFVNPNEPDFAYISGDDKNPHLVHSGHLLKAEGSSDNSKWFRASTDILNRNDWMVVSANIELDNYKNNPIFAWAHQVSGGMFDDPIKMENIIGKGIDYKQGDGFLDIEFEFVPQEIHPYGQMALSMVNGGFLTMTSVGIQAKEISFKQVEGNGEELFRQIDKSELREDSLVPIPANPEAQKLAASLSGDFNIPGFIKEKIERKKDGDELEVASIEIIRQSIESWETFSQLKKRYR